MVEVIFETNLDLYNESWPKSLPEIPKVGDHIESATIHPCNVYRPHQFRLSLEVVSITWKHFEKKDRWIPVVELHDRKVFKRSIQDFYKWYAPKVGKNVSYFI